MDVVPRERDTSGGLERDLSYIPHTKPKPDYVAIRVQHDDIHFSDADMSTLCHRIDRERRLVSAGGCVGGHSAETILSVDIVNTKELFIVPTRASLFGCARYTSYIQHCCTSCANCPTRQS